MGMLSSAVYVLTMDFFGPIADNAGGIVEMGDQPEEVREVTDLLDAVGNTTKAATKGFAISSAALACFLLFSAFMDEVSIFTGTEFKVHTSHASPSPLSLPSVPFPCVTLLDHHLLSLCKPSCTSQVVDIAVPEVFVGGMLGAMLVMVFSAWTLAAVSRSAQQVVVEVRRQFNEHPGIMGGSEKPNYEICVSLIAEAALREMVKPGVLAVGFPILTGFVFKMIGQYREDVLLGPKVMAGKYSLTLQWKV
jgi:Na+/H+-translocating membrane pyrophosphatase